MKILLVDDDYIALEGLKKMLDWETFGGKLTGCACDGTEAVELIQTTQPDLVISDIKMPEMDGLALAGYIYKHCPQTRMILMSGHSEFHYAQQALRYHVTDYILKPITRQKIQQLNQQLLSFSLQQTNKEQIQKLTYDDDLRNQIRHALKQADMPALKEIFTSFPVKEALCNDFDNTLGIQLLNYLFLYYDEISGEKNTLSDLKMKKMETYRKLSVFEEKIVYLTDCYNTLIEYVQNQKNEYDRPIIAGCLQIMESNFHDSSFNISFLADSLGLSLPYLSTVFKQTCGQTISSYLAEKRLSHAKELLCDISVPVREVSRRSGYEDPGHFSRLFKKHLGMTPSEYRNMHACTHLFSNECRED